MFNARWAAGEIIWRVTHEDAFASIVLDNVLKSSDGTARDKGFCAELVYGTLRWYEPIIDSLKRALDKPGKKLDKRIVPHLAVAAYQLLHLTDTIPAHAAVNAGVNAVRKIRPQLTGLANAILRNLGSPPHLQLETCEDIGMLEKAFGIPHILAEAIIDGLPAKDNFKAIAALNDRPKIWIRAFGNGERMAHPFVPEAFVLDKPGNIAIMDDFVKGNFIVQDPGSQVAALLIDAKPGDFAIDLCAAPGTKTMTLAKQVGESGKVIAVELDSQRAKRITENATRLKLKVDMRIADATKLEGTIQHETADHVLLDAPCSGLGTTRRHPEIKLRFTPENLDSLTKQQDELLTQAAKLVKSGGDLVYSVCSPLACEGSSRIEAFLQQHPEFKRINARDTLPWLPLNAVNEQGEILLKPHLHESDAFFCVKLQRRYT